MPALVPHNIEDALNQSVAYRALPPHQKREMVESLSRVLGYLGNAPARPFAPDLNALRGGSAGSAPPPQGGNNAAAPAPGAPAAPAAPGPNAFQRAAGATRE